MKRRKNKSRKTLSTEPDVWCFEMVADQMKRALPQNINRIRLDRLLFDESLLYIDIINLDFRNEFDALSSLYHVD